MQWIHFWGYRHMSGRITGPRGTGSPPSVRFSPGCGPEKSNRLTCSSIATTTPTVTRSTWVLTWDGSARRRGAIGSADDATETWGLFPRDFTGIAHQRG